MKIQLSYNDKNIDVLQLVFVFNNYVFIFNGSSYNYIKLCNNKKIQTELINLK